MCTGTPNMEIPEVPRPQRPQAPVETAKTLQNVEAAGFTKDGKRRRMGASGLLIPLNTGAQIK